MRLAIVLQAAEGGIFNFTGIKAFLVAVAGVAIVVVGVSIVFSAKKADMAKTANTSLNTFIGIIFIALGMGAVGVMALGGEAVDTLFGG